MLLSIFNLHRFQKKFDMNYLIGFKKLQPSSWINTIYVILKYFMYQFTSLKKMLERTPVCSMEKMGQGCFLIQSRCICINIFILTISCFVWWCFGIWCLADWDVRLYALQENIGLVLLDYMHQYLGQCLL